SRRQGCGRQVPRQLSPARAIRKSQRGLSPLPFGDPMPNMTDSQATTRAGWLRRLLDALYLYAGVAAAVSMVMILLIILAQMICRALGIAFPGSSDYAGYFMAQASF